MTGGAPNTPWPRLEDLGNRPPSETSLCSNVGRPKAGEAAPRRSTVTLRGSAQILPSPTTAEAVDGGAAPAAELIAEAGSIRSY